MVFSDAAEGKAWELRQDNEPLINATHDALARLHARSTVYNALAAARTSKAAPYVSTATVSRDMLNITNALGFEKLQYWGFS